MKTYYGFNNGKVIVTKKRTNELDEKADYICVGLYALKKLAHNYETYPDLYTTTPFKKKIKAIEALIKFSKK